MFFDHYHSMIRIQNIIANFWITVAPNHIRFRTGFLFRSQCIITISCNSISVWTGKPATITIIAIIFVIIINNIRSALTITQLLWRRRLVGKSVTSDKLKQKKTKKRNQELQERVATATERAKEENEELGSQFGLKVIRPQSSFWAGKIHPIGCCFW